MKILKNKKAPQALKPSIKTELEKTLTALVVESTIFGGDLPVDFRAVTHFKHLGTSVEGETYILPAEAFEEAKAKGDEARLELAQSELKKVRAIQANYQAKLDQGYQQEVALILPSLLRDEQMIAKIITRCSKKITLRELAEALDEAEAILKGYADNLLYLEKLRITGKHEMPPGVSRENTAKLEEEIEAAILAHNLETYQSLLVVSALTKHMNQLSDATLEACAALAKVEVLVKTARGSSLPFAARALQIKPDKRYYRVPMAAVTLFRKPALDCLPLQGVTEAELETLMVLHGGPAYQSLQQALDGARALL